MDLALSESVALVTGAASGIGLACARALTAEGARVGLIDRDERALVHAAGQLNADFAVADVTDEIAMRTAIDALAGRLGGVDVLICSAGISGPFGRAVEEISLDDWNAVLAVNLTGPFVAVKHALAHLRRARHPAIVIMGSDSAFVAAPGMVAYNASKGGVLQLTRALSVDLARDGIRVNCVCPSIVDTPMSRDDLALDDTGFVHADYPVQSAEEVATHVAYLCSPRSQPVNGTTLVSDFGYLARSSFPA